MSNVLFSTVFHDDSVQEENIIKARNFRFTRFFRFFVFYKVFSPDLKTHTLLINFRSSNRRTIFRLIDSKIVSKTFASLAVSVAEFHR